MRLVIENPYTAPHYLTDYWSLRPAIIDKDRRADGDYYRKPTQYFFVGLEPKQTLLFEPLEDVETGVIENTPDKTARSLIHPQYARRFIKQYIL